MKSHNASFILMLAITILVTWTSRAHAGSIPIFYSWGGEQFIKVADFPQTEEFRDKEGKHVDAGYRYKQFSIFWIPLWNYDGEWCGYLDSEHYLNISKSDLDEVARGAGVTLPTTPPIPFWDSYGGKLILGSLLLLSFIAHRASRNEEAPVTQQEQRLPATIPRGIPIVHVPQPLLPVPAPSYRIGSNGQDLGEFPISGIKHMLRSGTLTLQDYYFDTDRNEWLPLTSLPNLL